MTEKAILPIGVAIVELRSKRGISQIDLALKSGVDPRTLAAIEKGRIVNPSLDKMKRLAEALEMSLSELIGMAEAQMTSSIFIGHLSGEYTVLSQRRRVRLISYLPKNAPFFVGKLLLEGKSSLASDKFRFPSHLFLQIVIGKVSISLGQETHELEQGQTVLFDGKLNYNLKNSRRTTATLLLFSPSPLMK